MSGDGWWNRNEGKSGGPGGIPWLVWIALAIVAVVAVYAAAVDSDQRPGPPEPDATLPRPAVIMPVNSWSS